jgi:hypothetical protein
LRQLHPHGIEWAVYSLEVIVAILTFIVAVIPG